MKTILKYIAFAVCILFLLLVGGFLPEHVAHGYFLFLAFCVGTFIWFKRRAWHRKHKAARDEMIRTIRERQNQDEEAHTDRRKPFDPPRG